MEAIAIGVEAIAMRVKAIAIRLEAIAIRMEAIATTVEALQASSSGRTSRLRSWLVRRETRTQGCADSMSI